jgi:hypothetical protein
MSLLPLFQWCYDTPLGEAVRTSTFLFPVIEAFHLLAFGVTVGAVLVVNLRLLGTGLRKEPAAQLWAGARPWLIGGVIVMFASGIPLFFSEAVKCYYSFPFWVKMTSLLLALVFTFAVLPRVTRTNSAFGRSAPATVTAVVSLVLWFGVAWGGRWIGFSG